VAVGYLRRSTDRQEQSIPDQRKAIERYAAEHDLELARFFVDDAISGTSAVRRPAFQEMVGLAQQDRRPFSYVIVYDVKRFGRLDNDEAGYYRHILRTHGVEVLYVGENFSGDATDDLLRPVKQWQAREESKDLAKVTIRGMLSRVESGYWNGGSPPFGYDLRYESPREDGGAFLLVLRFQPDGSKSPSGRRNRGTRGEPPGNHGGSLAARIPGFTGCQFGRSSPPVHNGVRYTPATRPAFPAQRKEDPAGKGQVLSWKW
jgi:DNA invertase Pin-like site-specific DNA recombinase